MAPRGSRPPAPAASATRVPPVDVLSAEGAKRKMDELIDAFEACGLDAQQAASPASQLPLLDRAIDAASKAFDFYASLPRDMAVRVMSDREVRRLRDSALHVDHRLTDLVSPQFREINEKTGKSVKLLENMQAANAQRDEPLDLTRLLDAVTKNQQVGIDFWETKVTRSQRTLGIATVAAGLPGAPESHRLAEGAFLRRQAGVVLFSSFAALEQRVSLALREIADAAPQGATLPVADGELKHQLVAFRDDIQPAFQSIADVIFSPKPQSLDTQNRVVLEAVLGRLGEFASSLGDTLSAGQATPQGSAAPFDRIVESAWITASRVAGMLQVKEPEPPQPPATEARPPRKKDKGRRKAAAAGLAAAETVGAGSSSGKTIARSAFGTPRLVDASEQRATEVAASTAAASVEAWHQPPSLDTIHQRLTRLNELVGFDLPAQRKAVSQAYRDLSPEGARFAVEEVVQRLTQQADEMKACLTALADRRQLLLLSSSQLPVMHDRLKKLKDLHAEVQGVAKALQQGLEGSVMDRLKTYPLPTQKHIEELRKGGQLVSVEMPRALNGEPGTLFEVKLQPSALRNGAMPRPIWLHIHTKEPVHADGLATLSDAGFAATHVKSDTERGRNQQWQEARLREGHDNVVIYRGKITHALCRQLLGA